MRLVAWLRAGSVEREASLLKALAQAPLPRARDPSHAPGAGEAGAGPSAKMLDLELVCPQTLGNTPVPTALCGGPPAMRAPARSSSCITWRWCASESPGTHHDIVGRTS